MILAESQTHPIFISPTVEFTFLKPRNDQTF